ncbi:UPF0280 family protein [Acetobacterium bakii]|uniref:Thiamine biosynthesis protein ApbE n=1 Tax=Acetobacterium bakii TaxID=52689 RepID=A0A0L6U2Y2_9FIRM|nr:UPF0280 family protein [Acetobacterium bakii]KNZ42851.1 hypothetical protein AKG39_03765 [Acetobacterium bakii]
MNYEERIYRNRMKAEDLEYFQVLELETDLFIGVDSMVMNSALPQVALKSVKQLRQSIMDYNKTCPGFIRSLVPLTMDTGAVAIVQDLLKSGIATGIGPMGAVAGAVSKYIGAVLASFSEEIIVENGGDLLIKTKKVRRIALYTGNPEFSDIGLLIKPRKKSLGICTSSGILGHSLSFGKADAVTVVSEDIPLADAAATALCNRIKTPGDIAGGLDWIKTIPGILGALIIIEDQLGAWGEIELC